MKCYKGVISGTRLITGPGAFIPVKRTKVYQNKQGFFLVRDGVILNYLPVDKVFLKYR